MERGEYKSTIVESTRPVTSLEEQGGVSNVTESVDWHRTSYKLPELKIKDGDLVCNFKSETRGFF